MIEKIEYKGTLLAVVLRASYELEGVNFITTNDNPLQVGVLIHKQGAKIKAHFHKSSPKIIGEVQEVLHIEYGEVEAGFYDEKGKKIESITLKFGDTLLLVSGGHGFDVLRDCKIIEVKQGPYYGPEVDKEQLNVERKGRK